MTSDNRGESGSIFVVAGMPRGGTTFLYHNLRKHPSFFFPFRKEVNYFNVNYDRGVDWYRSLYAKREPEQIAADISPLNFLDTRSIERIQKHDPETKVIIVVRDPVEWAVSFYAQFKTLLFEMPEFPDFVNDGYDYVLGKNSVHIDFKKKTTVERIQMFRDAFGDNLLLYDFGYFKKNRLEVLKAIEQFLEVPPYFEEGNFDDMKINASGRRNVKMLSYVLNREWAISLIHKLVPRSLILKMRNRYDRGNVKNVDGPEDIEEVQQRIEYAEKALGDQRLEVQEFFSKDPIQLGSGESYSLSAVNA